MIDDHHPVRELFGFFALSGSILLALVFMTLAEIVQRRTRARG